MSTSTSEKLINYLLKQGFKLKKEDIELIRTTIYKSLTDAYAYKSNGCDCGQLSCAICCP